MTPTPKYYIGVDVGTRSARAMLVREDGVIILTASQATSMKSSSETRMYEQSSNNIWDAVCISVKRVMEGRDPGTIHGIGFDATCSLVVLNKNFEPHNCRITAQTDNTVYNVVVWMDHRAELEAEFINSTKHPVLKYVGGQMSPEMQPPKILWLKKHMSTEWWNNAGHFFDLPDYLTWRSTGSLSRSMCSVVCKFTYQASDDGSQGWDDSFWSAIGLGELCDDNYHKIGSVVQEPGETLGQGLTTQAALDMGLNPGTPVGTSIIDAHAGAVGVFGCRVPTLGPASDANITSKLALISGTSTCHMALSQEAKFVPGVWGPYYSALIPKLWLNEGGQSATGELMDYIINTHPAAAELRLKILDKNTHLHEKLNTCLEALRVQLNAPSVSQLTKHLHVYPDFHGNRSPIADPNLRGMINGLSMDSGSSDLALKYLATIQALAYGTRHIVDKLQRCGHNITSIFMCGGLSKNKLFVQIHADVTGLPVVIPDSVEAVLLGSAILGAKASGNFATLVDAMQRLGGTGKVVHPNLDDQSFHNKKFDVFLKMLAHQQEYKKIMEN